VQFNTWCPGLPPQLAGRVNPAVWAGFIDSISILGESQPNCLTQCFTCSCASASRNFEAGLLAIEQNYGKDLGATSFNRRDYQYQVWVNATAPDAEGRGGQPAHWENRSLAYLNITFAQPFAAGSWVVPQMAQMAPQVMAPPMQAPMAYVPPQPIYGQQPMQPGMPPVYGQQIQPGMQPVYGQQMQPGMQPVYGQQMQPGMQPVYGQQPAFQSSHG